MEKVKDRVVVYSQDKSFIGTNVITCAGLYSDRVAMSGGGDRIPRVIPFRGSYYEMKPEYINIVKRNIYPVPSNAGIPVGIHFTPTVRGQMIIGPGACLALHREGYKFTDFNVKDAKDIITNNSFWKLVFNNFQMSINELYKDLSMEAFLLEARKMVPSLKFEHTKRSFSGVMAQVLSEEGKNVNDFIFESLALSGTTLHVRNAPSPACTASFSLAEEIVDKAASDFHW